MEKLNWSVINI